MIFPGRDALPAISLAEQDALTERLYQSSPSTEAEDVLAYPETLPDLLNIIKHAALGYDLPLPTLHKAAQMIPAAVRSPEDREFLVNSLRGVPTEVEREVETVEEGEKKTSKVREIVYVGGIFDAVSAIHGLAHPVAKDHFNTFLATRDSTKLPATFIVALQRALGVYGVTSLNPSSELNEALYRIVRAHRDLERSNHSISAFIEIARNTQLRETVPALAQFQRAYVGEKQGISLVHLAHEAQISLEASDKREAWAQTFAGLFDRALKGIFVEEDTRCFAQGELIRTPQPAKRFLMERMGSDNPREVNLAMEILFERLYGGRSQNRGKHETVDFTPETDTSVALGTFRDQETRRNRSVVFVRANSVAEIPLVLEKAKAKLASCRTSDNVIEVSVLGENQLPQEASFESAIQAGVAGIPNLKRVTVGIAQRKQGNGPDAPLYRTYRPNGEGGKFIRHTLFDNIHPMDAWKVFELDRWSEKFEAERIPDVLLPEIYAFRAQDRASKTAKRDPRKEGDLRNIVIGQVTGDLSYKRFDGTLESKLIALYQRLQEKPQDPISPEEEMMIRAIPWGLKLAKVTAEDFDPFDIDVMQGSPRQILAEYLNEPEKAIEHLQSAARALDGKIYSVPEAEQQAINAAITMHRVQATTPNGPTDARVDLYIHAPLEASNDELAFTVGRLVHHFSDPRIEKTAIRFHRTEEGEYREYVASVRTPASTRIEMNVEPVTTRPIHEVRTSLVKKQLAALAKGNLYVYDRVNLLREAIRNIWPRELALPENAIELKEMVLKGNKLVEIERDPGKNREGMLVFETKVKFPKNLRGDFYERRMMWVGNDASIDGGGLGPVEARIYEAAFIHAMEEGIPIHYASDSSGAAMAGPMSGYAGQVFRSLNKTWSDSEKRWILWANDEQLNIKIGPEGRQKTLRELVGLGKRFQDGESQGTEINGLSGEIFLSMESLHGSAQTARVTALANKMIPVFASAHGVTIGIGTYDWVLSILNMIPVETREGTVVSEAAAALTGPRAVKETGLGDVRAAQDYSGAMRLARAGIASQTPVGEMGVAENMLRMLGLLPSHRGEEAIIVDTGDPKDRDVAADLARIIPGRGQPFNMREVVETLFDRGPLGGVFELWKEFGPTAITGFGRLNGRTVAYAFPQPKPDPVTGERGPFFGSTLDSESAFKVAALIRKANQLGIPLVMDPAFSGFMPDATNVSRRVYEGGAEIVRALEEFDGVVLQYLHPFAEWWGGCVAVSEAAINTAGNVTTIADESIQAGILGQQGALQVPKVSRVRDEAFNKDSRVIALRAQQSSAKSSAEKDEIQRQLDTIYIEITNQVGAFYMLVNTADRAFNQGSINQIIRVDQRGNTRGILIDALESGLKTKREKDATAAARQSALQVLRGLVTLTNTVPSLGIHASLEEVTDGKVRLCVGAGLCFENFPEEVWGDFQEILISLNLSEASQSIPRMFRGTPTQRPPR